MGTSFDILWKPPPPLVEDKDNYRWFYRIAELLNGGVPGATTMLSVPPSENKTGVTINKGQVCGYAGVSAGTMDLQLFIANGSQSAYSILGVASAPIEPNKLGYLIYYGVVDGINTSAWSPGTVLYASASAVGGLTEIPPAPPNIRIVVASVLSQSTNGAIFVRVYPQLRPGYGLFENQAASIAIPTAGVAIPIATAVISRGVSIDPLNNTHLLFEYPALFSVTLTTQVLAGSNADNVVTVWLRKNGVDVPGSATNCTVNGNKVARLSIVNINGISVQVGDYIQFMVDGSTTGGTLVTTPISGTTPATYAVNIQVTQSSI